MYRHYNELQQMLFKKIEFRKCFHKKFAAFSCISCSLIIQISGLSLTHLSLTLLRLTHLSLTHLSLTHLIPTFLSLTLLSLTHLSLTHLSMTHLSLTHLSLTHLSLLGHHAEAEEAMGFCYFNTVAITAHQILQFTGTQI